MSEAKQRLIETTVSLLKRQGYTATGLNQIVKESAAPKGSLYHYFPGGKEELAATAMDFLADEFLEFADEIALNLPDPVLIVEKLIDRFIEDLEASDFTECSSIAAVVMGGGGSKPRIREAAVRLYDRELAFATTHLRAAGWSEEGARTQGHILISTIEGAILLSKAYRNTEPLHLVKIRCRDLLSNVF